MIQVIGEKPVAESFKRALSIFLEDIDLLMVDVEKIDEAREIVEKSDKPIIFYGLDSELKLRLSGNASVPFFYQGNAAYFQVPFELMEIVMVYQAILDGNKIPNRAAHLASQLTYKENVVNVLLHDIHPSKGGCEKGLARAEREFSITGSVEEVREKLEQLRSNDSGGVKDLIGGEVLPGVFCDVEGTLLIDDEVNHALIKRLEKHSETCPVTIWTGGDVKRLGEKLIKKDIDKWPILSKYDFHGCRVEIIIDDLPEGYFRERYGISSEMYISETYVDV